MERRKEIGFEVRYGGRVCGPFSEVLWKPTLVPLPKPLLREPQFRGLNSSAQVPAWHVPIREATRPEQRPGGLHHSGALNRLLPCYFDGVPIHHAGLVSPLSPSESLIQVPASGNAIQQKLPYLQGGFEKEKSKKKILIKEGHCEGNQV